MTDFIFQVFKLLVTQVIFIFGIFWFGGLVLNQLQRWTLNNYQRSIGWQGILWTAWLGTPCHEFSHWLFAKIFKHQVTQFALFRPDPVSGELGFVHHRYNEKSFYQGLGNFFIGLGPMLLGLPLLLSLLYFLLPNGPVILRSLFLSEISLLAFGQVVLKVLGGFFAWSNMSSWSFWLFLYVSFCLASHLAPSSEDRRNIWSGFLFIIFILFFISLFIAIFALDFNQYFLNLLAYLNLVLAAFIYVIIVSFLHWLFSILLLVFRRQI